MSPTLLTLSFHLPQAFAPNKSNLREDACFKKYAFDSGLLTEEALGVDVPPDLAEQKESGGRTTPYSGLVAGKYRIDVVDVKQITLLRLGADAWVRPAFQSRPGMPSRFEEWFRPKVEAACDCLLLCGHHGWSGNRPALWGREDTSEPVIPHRFFTAVCPRQLETPGGAVAPSLEIWGHPIARGERAVLRAGPFDCSRTVASCRLLVIMGCSGVSDLGRLWQQWVRLAAGAAPIVLGWHGSHGMPKDKFSESFSERFWRRLGELASAHQPRRTLAQLCELQPVDVIQAWGAAVKAAFAAGEQSHLWFAGRKLCAGALDPEGGVWRVRSASGVLERDA